ncbi:hypothetical protein [Vibrio diabolicus]|uniref:hypothetical protein n=1 Tax=Vibrio diabolicus TaxID=50719 RepID=UPI0021519528|nr:hypothetical protein [Vibrio diabolicus]MCE9832947.1 hypothetical protein [Vibrio diabolicus]MCS0418535.1 hypothetical protein [Vibrio diabolicus]
MTEHYIPPKWGGPIPNQEGSNPKPVINGEERAAGCFYQGEKTTKGYLFKYLKNGKVVSGYFPGRNLDDAAQQCYTAANESI